MAIQLSADIKAAKKAKQTRRERRAETSERNAGETELVVKNVSSVGWSVDADARRAMIEKAAYYRAEQRGFAPGYELEDWLAAEAEADAHLYGETHSF